MSEDVRSTQELLPWLTPLTDGLVVCKDSSFLACFEFHGADADSVGEGEVYQVGQAADRLIRLMRDLPVTLWWTVRREKTDDYPAEVMPDPISQMLDDEHRASFETNAAYVNRHFFSIIWMPERSTSGMFGKIGTQMGDGVGMVSAIKTAVMSTYFGKQSFAWKAAEIDQAVSSLEERLGQVESVMATLNFRRLRGQEFLGFLWAQANPGQRMTPKVWNGESYFDALLSEGPIIVHRDGLIFGDDSDPVHASLSSMKSWPTPVAFGAFNALVSLPSELVISHCFRVMNNDAANKHINQVKALNDTLKYPLKSWVFGMFKQGEMNESSADPARASAALEAIDAKGELNGGEVIFGYHNLSVMLLDRDPERLEQTNSDMMRMFNSSPFIGAVRENMHALSAWATTLPGQWQECRRWMTLSSANVVDIAPLLGVSMGARENEHMTEQMNKRCQALTVLPTDFNTPYYFNFHAGALAHAMVIGPSRSGKSLVMNFLMSQFRKYGTSASLVIFDKDYSCRIATLLQGGDHVDLRGGSNVQINPLLLAGDRASWGFLAGWIEGLISSRGHVVASEDFGEIYAAIESIASNDDPAVRRLLTVQTLLPRHLAVHLDEWVGSGSYANYFDNLEDSFNISDFICIEMGEIMGEPRVARAFMDYAFYRLMSALKSQRSSGSMKTTLIYVEECWFLMEDPHFAARLKDWLKTFAKLNAFLVLTTQSIEDMAELPVAVFASVRDNIQTKIFLPNPMARTESLSDFYRKKFDLPQSLVDRIASGIPRQDYFIVQPEVSRKVRIALTSRQVAALRSDTLAQRVFEPIYQSREGNPDWPMRYVEEMTKPRDT